MFASNYQDLVGMRFGDLKVISQAESQFSKRKDGNKMKETRKWNCECVCGNSYEAFEYKLKNGKTKDCGCKVHRDRVGMIFGRLKITGYKKDENNKTLYLCDCECGNAKEVVFNSLKSGRVLSCGCLLKEYKNSGTSDLTGMKFGRLKVMRELDYKINKNRIWECECECGNIVNVKGVNLDSGVTKSCGCYAIDSTIERSRKYNRYEFVDDYVIIDYGEDKKIYIDKDDFDKFKYYDYWVRPSGSGEYPCYKKDGKYNFIHREIMGLDEYDMTTVVDHINRNRSDNRKSNLRISDFTGNARNSGLQKNNTTGIIGVQWHKRDKKWYSTIGVDNDKIYLGVFDNKEEAIIARLKAELKCFGKEFSPQRELFEEYGIHTD